MLEEGETFVADADMSPGATMQGTVTNQHGVGRPNVCVQVVDKEGWSAGAGLTDADGNYTIHGLPEGAGITAEFRVCGFGSSVRGMVERCADLCRG